MNHSIAFSPPFYCFFVVVHFFMFVVRAARHTVIVLLCRKLIMCEMWIRAILTAWKGAAILLTPRAIYVDRCFALAFQSTLSIISDIEKNPQIESHNSQGAARDPNSENKICKYFRDMRAESLKIYNNESMHWKVVHVCCCVRGKERGRNQERK